MTLEPASQSRCGQDTGRPESCRPAGVTNLGHPEGDFQEKLEEADRAVPIKAAIRQDTRRTSTSAPEPSSCAHQLSLTSTQWASESVAPCVSLKSRERCSRDKETLLTTDHPEKTVWEEELALCPLPLASCARISRSQLPPLHSGLAILPG